jgi:hypothetical protein
MKVINIDSHRFVLPEGMTIKEVQALVGFLAVLSVVESHYNYDESKYTHSLGGHPEVKLLELDLNPNAKAEADASYQRYTARRAAEEATS